MMKFDEAHGLLKEEIGTYQEEVSRIHRMIHENAFLTRSILCAVIYS